MHVIALGCHRNVSQHFLVLSLCPELRIAVDGQLDGLIHWHDWLVVHVLLGPLTTVEVVGAGQSHCHWCEGGTDLFDRLQDLAHKLKDDGQGHHQPVRQVVFGGGVAKACYDPTHERPEVNRVIVRDVVCLKHKSWIEDEYS